MASSDSITKIEVGGDAFKERWGVLGCEYVVTNTSGSTQQDFQDLMIYITEKRATAIESEVSPMETRIRKRNTQLENLGAALSKVTSALDNIDTSEDVDDQYTWISTSDWSDAAKEGIALADTTTKQTFYNKVYTSATSVKWTKSELDQLSQLLKTKTDRLNNDSSSDSTRLEGLVDRRDEAFSTASTLMTNISDTRSNLIKNV